MISVVYIPPNSCDAYHEKLHSYLTNLVNESKPIILLGDLNHPDVHWATYIALFTKTDEYAALELCVCSVNVV